jgi:hypothetical protein
MEDIGSSGGRRHRQMREKKTLLRGHRGWVAVLVLWWWLFVVPGIVVVPAPFRTVFTVPSHSSQPRPTIVSQSHYYTTFNILLV